jgi:uncharacterized membrane protein
MPYCSNCGNQVRDTDLYCGKCGTRQPIASAGFAAAPPPQAATNPLSSINDRTASLLCYIPVVGWIASIVVLASERFRNQRTVRFHAFQGLYLFVAWLLVEWVVAPMFWGIDLAGRRAIIGMFKVGIFATWIFMLIKVSQDQLFKLPLIGELADRSLTEQRL